MNWNRLAGFAVEASPMTKSLALYRRYGEVAPRMLRSSIFCLAALFSALLVDPTP